MHRRPARALPLGLPVRDAAGQPLTLGEAIGGLPAVFAFADYDCTTLCGTALGLAAATLPGTGLRPGQDYRLVVLGLDAADGPDKARAMRQAWLGDSGALARTAAFLRGRAGTWRPQCSALGYAAPPTRRRLRPSAGAFRAAGRRQALGDPARPRRRTGGPAGSAACRRAGGGARAFCAGAAALRQCRLGPWRRIARRPGRRRGSDHRAARRRLRAAAAPGARGRERPAALAADRLGAGGTGRCCCSAACW